MSSVVASQAQDRYIVTDLGVLPGGIINQPARVTQNGKVTGFTQRIGGKSAFLHNGTSLIDLGTLPGRNGAEAMDMNTSGLIIGTSGSGNSQKAFLWQNGAIQEILPNFFNGLNGNPGPVTAGAAVNSAGYQVVNDLTNQAAWVITPAGRFSAAIFATAMNDRNRIVGTTPDGSVWLWTPPILPETTDTLTESDPRRQEDTVATPYDITDTNIWDTDQNFFVGTSGFPTGGNVGPSVLSTVGFCSPGPTDPFYMPPLQNDNVSEAHGVNRSNVIVGRSGRLFEVNGQVTVQYRGCIWYPIPFDPFYVGFDIQQLLPANTSIVIDNLISMNNVGQITGTYTRNGEIHCIRLDPVNVPVSLTIDPNSIPGGLNTIGTVQLNNPAPFGGTIVNVRSNNGIAQVPATVTVPQSSTQVNFNIVTSPVTVSTPLLITAERFGYTQTAQLRVQPTTLQSVAVNPNRITGGLATTGTVQLLGNAPTSGMPVALATSNVAYATVPASITVPAGANRANFPINTNVVTSNKVVTVTATAGGLVRSATFTVSLPFLESITVNPTSVLGGTAVTGTALITNNALGTGARVLLNSSAPSAAAVPTSVLVLPGTRSQTFSITTSVVQTTTNVIITGNFNSSTKTAALTVRAPELIHLLVSPSTVLGLTASKGSVVLNAPAPVGGAAVSLSSSDAGAVPPGTVTIPQGATYKQFNIATNVVQSTRSVTLVAVYLSVSKTATLIVQGADLVVHNVPTPVMPPPMGAYPIVVTCTCVLNRPAQVGGANILLFTSDNTTALPPFGLTIPPGSSLGTYQLTVLKAGTAELTATRGAISITRPIVAQ
ncbi:MAG: hypothetical protein ABL949_11290 [Fimbriimonadaceae bacterium]